MLTAQEQEQGYIEIEAWIAVDAEEHVWAHEDVDALKERLADDDASITRRIIRVLIKVQVPCAIEVEATLPPEGNEATVKVS